MTRALKILPRRIAPLLIFLMVFSGLQVFSFSNSYHASAAVTSGSIAFNGNSTLTYWGGAIAPNGNSSSSATIEFWMKPPSGQGTGCCTRVFSQNFSFGDATNPLILRYGGGGNFFLTVANKSTTASIIPTAGQWNHIAIVDSSGEWKLYVNGALSQTIPVATIGASTTLTNGNFTIGGDSGGERFSGSISNFRYVKGTAIYSGAFTPPTTALTAVSGTVILLNTNYDGTLATAQLDGSSAPITPTLTGSPDPTASNSTPILTAPSISNFTVPSLTYGAASTLSATSSVPGTFTFLADGSGIGCSNVVEDGSKTSTCIFTPTKTSSISFTLNFTPTSSSYATLTNQNAMPITPTKAILNVVPSNRTVSYGGTPTYSFSYSGFVNSESSSSSTFTSGLTPPSCIAASYTTSSSVSVSPLQITCSGGSATNYTFNYSSTSNLTISQATPTFSAWSNVSKVYGASSFDLTTPTSSTTGTWTYSSATPAVVSLSGATATVAGNGSSLITATFTPTDSINYVSGGTTTMTVTVGKPTLSVTASSHTVAYGGAIPTITPTISGFVNGEDSSVVTGISCTTTYTTTTSVGTTGSSCSGGTASNYSLTYTAGVITIGKATPTFTWRDTSKTFGDATFTVTAPTVTGSLGGSFSYSSANTSVIGVSGTTFTVVGSGTSVITATFSPTDATNYSSATTTMTITVGASAQTITRTSTSPTSPVKSGTYTPTATASSSLTVSIAIASESANVCSIASGVVNFNAPGNCVINYNQGGNTNYSAATQVTETLSVGKETPTFSAWSNVSKVYENGDFTLTAPTVTGSLPGTFTYSSATSSVISLVGNLATVAGAGTAVITATFTPTDSTNYNTATTTMTVTVAKVSPRFSTADVSKAFGAAPFSLSNPYVFRNLTGTFTFSSASTSVIALNGRVATVVGVGTSVITATFTPDDTNNYITGATTTFNVTVTQGGQTNALVVNSTSVTYGSTLSLTTTGGSGSGSNSFVVDSGPCTVLNATLTPTAAGTCMVTATKAANGNYLTASSVSTAITVNPKALTISGLTGANKEYDGTSSGTATGTPSLIGVVNSDNVLLGGTPTFTFASANVANGISMSASGYTLTGTTAGNYTLTQPTVTANITAKAARVAATNTTRAFGATITSGVTASGLISPDAVGSASYTYTGTGTSTPPTAVGVYTVTPSNAVFSTGLIGNYSITYDTATVTILAKYTITYNANGGSVSNGSTATIDFVVGDTALTLPTPTRANYTFTGWYTLQTNGVQVTGAYTPTATATLWARWIQNSLYGMGTNTKILTITTLSGVGNTYSANAGGGTIAIEYLADALPAGTVIDAYVLSDTSTATSLIGAGNDYVMSLVLAWVATDGTVPTTATGKAISMTVTNSSIKRGAKIYSVIGVTPTLLTTATADGSAVISITDDPQIIIAITKPDAPTGVSATSGGNASTTVSWTAPSDAGSVITGYTATSNAGQTCTSTSTSCSVTGLTNGTPYTFTVTATNSIGVSDPSSASSPITPAAPVVTPPSSGGGGGGGSTYVAPTPTPTPTIDPAIAAAAAKALADAKAAEEKAAAEAKALAEKRVAEEAALLAQIKALQEKADAEALAAAKKLQEELAATQLKAEEELKAATALKLAEEQRIAAERAAAAKKITTMYSTTAAFKLNTIYTKRLTTYTKKIAAGSQVTCIGYAKSSKTVSYATAKIVANKQAKALCTSMKKINQTLVTKSVVYPASKAPVTTVNKKWIPVSYRVEVAVN